MKNLNSKVMSAKEAVDLFVHDGDCIALGGFSTNRRAYGLVHEIIRQEKRRLHVESGGAGGDVDMLIGARCVETINISYIANSGFTMVCRRFREAVEKGELLAEDYSLDVQTAAYHAAALGLAYVPLKNMLGSDMVSKWGISEEERKKHPKLPPKKLILADDPFEPGSRLCLVPAPKIDVACIHVHRASPGGICEIEGSTFQDEDIAIAAKRTIVSCDELATEEELRRTPGRNTLPGLCVDAVVPMKYGAHPSQCYGKYDYDCVFFREYDIASRTQAGFDKFADRFIRSAADHDEYLDIIGKERLESLRVDPRIGYVKGLNRGGERQ